jgi:pimeloyl-ACP methyl ester carboxylesterase
MKIYGISGLGADERVFQYLNLPNFTPIHWIPTIQNEGIASYSHRLSDQINTSQPFILIAVSFGGLIATELNKTLAPEKTILISSITKRDELPWLYRLIGKLGVLKTIPKPLLNPPFWLMKTLFRAKNEELLRKILKDTDLTFLKWAMIQLTNWSNTIEPKKTIRIHGTKDYLLPAKGNIDHSIEDGGHFMIVDVASQLKELIKKSLSDHE